MSKVKQNKKAKYTSVNMHQFTKKQAVPVRVPTSPKDVEFAVKSSSNGS